MDDSKIYFLDFIFNPRTRTLQKNDIKVQLRKKQADVLSLLCTKYPEPVSREDFLTGAWNGGYVTTQSIAQVIRTLRLNLNDTNKKIIVTIPKLGYRFTVKPLHQDPNPDGLHSQYNCQKRENLNHTNDETLPEEDVIPALLDDSMERKTALCMKALLAKKRMPIRKICFSAVFLVAIFLFLIFI